MYRKVLAVVLFTLVLVTSGWTEEPKRTTLKRYTTYETSLTNEDIMRLFVNEVRNYLQQYDRYGCYYAVYFSVTQHKVLQDRSWETSTTKMEYPTLITYCIDLHISNGSLWIQFCNKPFSTNGTGPAREIATTRPDTVGGSQIRQYIVDMLTSMFDESEMALKMNNDKYSDKTKTAFLAEIMRILF
jgi:hypothetical protein